VNIPKEKLAQFKKTLYDYIRIHAKTNGRLAFLITESGTLSYGGALNAVEGLASFFIKLGIKKGELIALRATRSADVALLTIALCAIGAVAVMTDAHFGVKEYIADSGVDIHPDWWITNEKVDGSVSASENWELLNRDGNVTPFEIEGNEVSMSALEAASSQVQPEDPFMIIFTSGSTGKSKAVILSHRAVIANPTDAMPLFKENAKDVAISLLPLNHVFGYAVISCAVFCGHSVVFPPAADADTVLEYISKYRVSCLYCVPTFFLGLLADGKHKNYDISSLRLGLMAGGPFTERQMRFVEGELGLELMPGYGMSECVGISTMSYGDPVRLRAAGVGRLYPMTEAYILDENGNELSTGEAGEICVRGMTMMSGYYASEEETRAAFDEQNRLHTGDIGYFDEEGILHVNGRKKDLIIRGGENISAVGIERALLQLKDVYLAAVVGIPDEKFGEVPCAMVVLQKGFKTDEGQIKERLKGLLPKHLIPAKIIIVQEFPLTSSGKPDKHKIKEMFL